MGLAAQTSLKASQCISAAFVANRVALREIELDKFDAHENSREVLRGSSFASKELFGPLPDSLKNKLSAQNGERFMFTPKLTSQPQTKRQSSAPKWKKVVAPPVVNFHSLCPPPPLLGRIFVANRGGRGAEGFTRGEVANPKLIPQ